MRNPIGTASWALFLVTLFSTAPAAAQVTTTVAGKGTIGPGGGGGPSTSAQFFGPTGVAVESAGNVYVADYCGVRLVDATTGIISTVAGNGTCGFSGDGGAATSAGVLAGRI